MARGPSHLPGLRGEANIPNFSLTNPESESPNGRRTRGSQQTNNQ